EEAEPFADFLQQAIRDSSFLLAQFNRLEELKRLLDGHGTYIANIPALDLHLPRFRPQPRPIASGADRVSAVPAQKHAHMQLVLLALQMVEEAAHPVEPSLALNHQALLFGAQVSPGN